MEKEATSKQSEQTKTTKKRESKAATGKETRLDKPRKETKDAKDKKMKPTAEEQTPEENFSPDFPEMVVFASFTDLPLNKLSASTEVVSYPNRYFLILINK